MGNATSQEGEEEEKRVWGEKDAEPSVFHSVRPSTTQAGGVKSHPQPHPSHTQHPQQHPGMRHGAIRMADIAREAQPDTQRLAPGQAISLPTDRVPSSIPISNKSGTWQYPSPQMFYGAMLRKGWDPTGIRAEDIEHVVAIHNHVNEKCWREIMKWEARNHSSCSDVSLVRFEGRHADLSPQSRLYMLFGYKRPFDRHDWVIDRCGKEIRYVIDFYEGVPEEGKAISMFMDVRPALDSPEAAWDRLKFLCFKMWRRHDTNTD